MKIIKEDISKSTNAALVYHRTKSIKNIKKINNEGFDPGDGAYYGRGFYKTERKTHSSLFSVDGM